MKCVLYQLFIRELILGGQRRLEAKDCEFTGRREDGGKTVGRREVVLQRESRKSRTLLSVRLDADSDNLVRAIPKSSRLPVFLFRSPLFFRSRSQRPPSASRNDQRAW